MAQESIEFPVTEKPGKKDGYNTRRNSTGKVNPSYSSRVPNYLRASTGSCHDHCKYGKHHDFEEKAKSPMAKRAIEPKRNQQRPVQSGVVADRKTTVVKLKHPSEPRSPSPLDVKVVKREASTPSRKDGFSNSTSLNTVRTSSSSKSAVSLISKPMAGTSSSSADAKGLHKRNSNVRVGERKGTARVEKKASVPLVAAVPCKPSLTRVASITKHKSLKVVSQLKVRNATRKSDLSKHASLPLKAAKSSKPPVAGSASLNARRIGSKAGTPHKNQMTKKVEPKSVVKHDEASMLVKNGEDIRPMESQSMARETMESTNEENPLHGVNVDTENKISGVHQNISPQVQPSSPSLSHKSSSDPKSLSPDTLSNGEDDDSDYTVTASDEWTSEDSETAHLYMTETSVLDSKRRPMRDGMFASEDKDSVPTKLKFRRGRVVDLQAENNGPKRLRFRQARILGENETVNGSAKRRIYRRRVRVDDQNVDDSTSEKVILRHQNAQGKKDAQGLFNNVIEETASKLAETRKSKVKALVGAFETVISLQDSRSPTHAS